MKKTVLVVTFLFSIVILLFSFDSKTLATQQKITETTIQNQDKQLEAFNNIVNKMNTLARNIESRGDLYFDENDVLHFRYKESEYTSDKAVREWIYVKFSDTFCLSFFLGQHPEWIVPHPK